MTATQQFIEDAVKGGGKRNKNGHFVASSDDFLKKKFRLLNKNTGLMQELTLQKLISTTFRRSQFEYRGEFTGLKDKNGKEIYEGDILGGYGKDHPCGEYVSDVMWNTKKGEWYLRTSWIGGQRNLWRWCEKCVVIGNIYENQELLPAI